MDLRDEIIRGVVLSSQFEEGHKAGDWFVIKGCIHCPNRVFAKQEVTDQACFAATYPTLHVGHVYTLWSMFLFCDFSKLLCLLFGVDCSLEPPKLFLHQSLLLTSTHIYPVCQPASA
jgi:hypothetical protein